MRQCKKCNQQTRGQWKCQHCNEVNQTAAVWAALIIALPFAIIMGVCVSVVVGSAADVAK